MVCISPGRLVYTPRGTLYIPMIGMAVVFFRG